MEITIIKNVQDACQEHANEIRSILKIYKTLMVNLIGSPGSGKTSLLEKTLERINGQFKTAVIEGDVASDQDARRLQKFGIPIALINTERVCHIEPLYIKRALGRFDLKNIDIVFVENVGDLVCPAEFDIGEYAEIAVSSVAEGHDKPEKYPLLFHECKLVLLNKMDLISYTDFNREVFYSSINRLNTGIPVIELSCRSETGIEKWIEWLIGMRDHVINFIN